MREKFINKHTGEVEYSFLGLIKKIVSDYKLYKRFAPFDWRLR